MDDVDRKKIYELLHIATILETVDSDVNSTEQYVESLIERKPTPDFMDDIMFRNDAIIMEKLTNLKKKRTYLQKEIKVFNNSIDGITKGIDGITKGILGGSPTFLPQIPQTITSQQTQYQSNQRSRYRPQTSRTNLISLINEVTDAEKELIDVLLYSLINRQWEEIDKIKKWVYQKDQNRLLNRTIAYNARPLSPTILQKQISTRTLPRQISTRTLPRQNANRPNANRPNTSNQNTKRVHFPNIYKSGGSPFYTGILDTLKTNCDNFNKFLLENYTKLKDHVHVANESIKQQLTKESASYGKLSLFGKLTFVETAFFRLLKYSVERIIGTKEGRIDQVKDGFIGKVMYFFSLFSSYTGIALPPLLSIIGLTAIEVAIKTAIIVAGCKVLGILLAINVSIMILFYIKKAIDKRSSKAINAIRGTSPEEFNKQPKVTGLMHLIKPNMTQVEYDNLKSNIKDFIFGVKEEEDQPLLLPSPEDLKTEKDVYDKFPNINVTADEDKEVLESLINSTYNMIGNTEEPIGQASDNTITKGAFINVMDKDNLDDIDKKIIKIPKQLNVNILKKLTCSLVLNMDVADNDTTNFINKINKIAKIIGELKGQQKGGGIIHRKLMLYKLKDLHMYYNQKTGLILDPKLKKQDIVRKIIAITKSNNF